MHIEYVNVESYNPEDIAKTHVVVGGRKHRIPQTSFAYAQAYTCGRPYLNYEQGIKNTLKMIRDIINSPDLDDARYVVVTYQGKSFEESLHYREELLYGKYGFKAVLTDDRLLVGVANDDNEIEFLKPECVFN